MERHYGMDWLRIGAFALLILYHIGMFFVHWGWHVKTAQPAEWVAIPMLATNAWRLSLLFVVSGFASRALFVRDSRVARFAANRSYRLMLPVIFAMIFLIAPQPWVELVTKHGYESGFWHFWTHDYFRFDEIAGIAVPTWQHLWFVVYLWIYTLALALLLAVRRGGALLQRGFDAVFGDPALLLALPIGWIALVKLVLLPGAEETHALFGDWAAHAIYLPMFLFGWLLAGSPRVIEACAAQWKAAAAIGLLGYAGVAGVEFVWPGDTRAPEWAITFFHAVRSAQAWGTIVALIGIAHRFWNRDHPQRRMLTEAVFPFYIIHQTIIVVVAFWLLPLALPRVVEFGILVAATVAGCWGFYLAGREIGPLRPLIGLRARVARPASSATKAPVL